MSSDPAGTSIWLEESRLTLHLLCRNDWFSCCILLESSVQQRVRNDQPLDGTAADNVRFDDLVDIGRRDVAIPHRLRIDYDCGAKLALIEASGFVGSDRGLDPALGELYFEQAMKLAGAGRITAPARVPLGPLVYTYENVSLESWHELFSDVF